MRSLLWCSGICCALVVGCADNDRSEFVDRDDSPPARTVADTPDQDSDASTSADTSAGEQGSPAPRALAYPTGDKSTSMLLIEADPPEKVMVGKEYQYEIKLTNLTKNMMLNHVEVMQELPESVELVKAEQPQKQGKESQQQNKQQQQEKQPEQGDQQKQQQAEQSQQQSQESQSDAEKSWQVEQLKPGETAIIQVTAMGNEQGSFGHCIGVRYDPVLCLATEFVKPELQLTKAVPDQADLCQAIVYRYTITNSGSGEAKGLTITDPLPEGFQTEEGKDEVKFDVESLASGKSQQFDVRVLASEAGEFSSRATAKGAGELSATSAKPTTTVTAPELEIAADGPSVLKSGEAATYEVTVTNNGETKAEQVRLSAELAQNIRVLKTSDPYEEADVGLVWALGNLEPGKSRKLWIRLTGREAGEMTHQFTASTECARQRESDLAQAEVSTEVISLPALALVTADAQDPVKVGEQVTYDVAVVNEGTAPANNVQVVANLPEQMKLESVSGHSEGESEGNQITFPAVEELAPGESLEWRITANVEEAGSSKLEVQLTSDTLQDPAISQEPTRLIGESTESRSASSASKETNEAKSKQR